MNIESLTRKEIARMSKMTLGERREFLISKEIHPCGLDIIKGKSCFDCSNFYTDYSFKKQISKCLRFKFEIKKEWPACERFEVKK